jgi:hypothetical protein
MAKGSAMAHAEEELVGDTERSEEPTNLLYLSINVTWNTLCAQLLVAGANRVFSFEKKSCSVY